MANINEVIRETPDLVINHLRSENQALKSKVHEINMAMQGDLEKFKYLQGHNKYLMGVIEEKQGAIG